MPDDFAPAQLDLNQHLPVTLSLAAWNSVLTMIAKAPWDVADPLMQTIRRQLAAALVPSPPPPPAQHDEPIPKP